MTKTKIEIGCQEQHCYPAVRACVRACVCVRVRARARACVRGGGDGGLVWWFGLVVLSSGNVHNVCNIFPKNSQGRQITFDILHNQCRVLSHLALCAFARLRACTPVSFKFSCAAWPFAETEGAAVPSYVASGSVHDEEKEGNFLYIYIFFIVFQSVLSVCLFVVRLLLLLPLLSKGRSFKNYTWYRSSAYVILRKSLVIIKRIY